MLSLIGAGVPALAANGDKFEFQVLFTSDLHGCFSDWSYSTNTPYTGLGRVATKINELKAENPNTILIDVGDTIQGNGTSVFNTSAWDNAPGNTQGMYPALIGMNYLGYDAWVLGNHEFNFGIDRLEKAFGKGNTAPKDTFNGAILAGNVFDSNGNPVFDSYYIKEFDNGLRVAIVGMTHPNIVNWDAGNMAAAGYTADRADIETANTIAYLKDPANEAAIGGAVDIIIAAEHMGEGSEAAVGDGATDVLNYGDNAQDISLFIGAHGHLNVDKMINGVRFVELASNGARLGQVNVTATEQPDGSWKVADKDADVVMTNNVISNSAPADPGYMAAVSAADSFAKAYSNTVIGALTGGPLVPAPELKGTYQAYFQDTALVHRINEAMVYYANSYLDNDGPVATLSSLSTPVERDGQKVFLSGTAPLDTNANAQPGPLTRGSVSTIYKYDNNTLCIVEMTGAQFKQWMEWAYLFIGPYDDQGTKFGSEYFNLGPLMQPGDLTVPYGNGNMPGYNMDQFEGVNYKVDLTQNYGNRIIDITNPDGSPFDLGATYWVAVNNYRTDSQLTINAAETSRPAVFPAGTTPAKVVARDIDTQLTVNGTTITNGEGMLGVMIDWINRVNGGTINNSFTPNWEYITPVIDSAKRAAAVTVANLEYNSGNTNFLRPAQVGTSTGNNYAKRALTESDAAAYSDKLVIIHVNDAHGRDVKSSTSVGAAGVAQLKEDFEATGANVLLVSAGDAIQGTPLVNIDEGKSAIGFMDAAGYDLMVPGNHEFDYGKDQLLTILEDADFDVLSANIFIGDPADGNRLFPANKIFEIDGKKIGVFGLTTPETYTKTHPDKIAGLSFLMDQPLYDEAQAQVDYLAGQGCDLIICVGHLGTDAASAPNQSTDVIAHVNGIDLWIDGHSHTQIDRPGKLVAQPNGNNTLLVSAKQYLEYVGVVVYNLATDKLEDAYLLAPAAVPGADPDVAKLVNDRNAEVEALLAVPIGDTEVTLYGKNTVNPPGVRMSETNLGNFAADALRWTASESLGYNVDIAITNGGGIRDSIPTDGRDVSASNPYSITMKDMVTVFPFGNTVTVIRITGAQLLEALEAATYCTPAVVGAFPQVSGITFEIHTYVPYVNGPQYAGSTYYAPANPGARIQNVKVGGEPLDLNKTYDIATNDFTAAGGDTYSVFKQCIAFTNLGIPMENSLIDYLAELDGTVVAGSIYAAPQGRIKMVTSAPSTGGGSAVGGGTVTASDGAVSVNFTQSGGSVTLTMPEAKINEIIDTAKAGAVSLDLTGVRNATEAILPGAAITAFADAGLALELKLPQGTLALDAVALESLSEQAGGANVSVLLRQLKASDLPQAQTDSVKSGDLIFSISIMAGDKLITNFSGTLTVTVAYKGPLPVAVWYLDNAGKLTRVSSVYDAAMGTVTFTTNHLSVYVVRQDTGNPFIDIKDSNWFYDDVLYAYYNGLMLGASANTFEPNAALTRAMVVTILYRLAGSPDIDRQELSPFADVTDMNSWYYNAVVWAAGNSIVTGYAGKFSPNDSITRQDLSVILYRYADFAGLNLPSALSYAGFDDVSLIAAYAKNAVEALFNAGVINGRTGNTFDPLGNATRAEAAAMLHRFIENTK